MYRIHHAVIFFTKLCTVRAFALAVQTCPSTETRMACRKVWNTPSRCRGQYSSVYMVAMHPDHVPQMEMTLDGVVVGDEPTRNQGGAGLVSTLALVSNWSSISWWRHFRSSLGGSLRKEQNFPVAKWCRLLIFHFEAAYNLANVKKQDLKFKSI